MTEMTVGQAAKYCKVTPATIRNWFDKGWVHGRRDIYNARIITQEELERHMRVRTPQGKVRVEIN